MPASGGGPWRSRIRSAHRLRAAWPGPSPSSARRWTPGRPAELETQLRIILRLLEPPVLASAAPMGRDDPEQDGVARQEGLAKRFPVAEYSSSRVRLAAPCAREREEDQPERVIQPGHRRSARPDHLADGSVVPVHDPTLAEPPPRRGNEAPPGARLPVFLPVERIELDMASLEDLGEVAGKGGLPAAARSHHDHSSELVKRRALHGSQRWSRRPGAGRPPAARGKTIPRAPAPRDFVYPGGTKKRGEPRE